MDKFFKLVAPVVLVGGFIVTAFVIINYFTINSNRKTSKTYQTYTRSTNCFLAIPAEKRTRAYIDMCYDKAEAATGVKVERYGR